MSLLGDLLVVGPGLSGRWHRAEFAGREVKAAQDPRPNRPYVKHRGQALEDGHAVTAIVRPPQNSHARALDVSQILAAIRRQGEDRSPRR
jgi:hypothetical protein